jgi:hypothetical protein
MGVPGKKHPDHDNNNRDRAGFPQRWLDCSIPNREPQYRYEHEEGSNDEDYESLRIRH